MKLRQMLKPMEIAAAKMASAKGRKRPKRLGRRLTKGRGGNAIGVIVS